MVVATYQGADRPKHKREGKYQRGETESNQQNRFIFGPGDSLKNFNRIFRDHLEITARIAPEDQQLLSSGLAKMHVAETAPMFWLPGKVFHAVDLNRSIRVLGNRSLRQH